MLGDFFFEEMVIIFLGPNRKSCMKVPGLYNDEDDGSHIHINHWLS